MDFHSKSRIHIEITLSKSKTRSEAIKACCHFFTDFIFKGQQFMAPILLTPTNKFSMRTNVEQKLSLLERCSNMEELKQIHAQMHKTGLVLDVIPISKLLAFCALPESGNLVYAQRVFDRISRPNTIMWNTMIRGYSNSNKPEEALFLYKRMLCHSVPHNSYTFPFLLKACSRLDAIKETQQVHSNIIKMGFGLETYAINSLIHLYAKSGFIDSARILFDRVPKQDSVSWNSMIDGYLKYGDMDTALKLFQNMPAKSVVSWTTMISGYVEAGLTKEALNLFHEMQLAGVKPDNVVLASMLSGCADLGALDQGRWIHAYIEKNGIRIDSILGCVLIDMYAKCGEVDKALEVFAKIEKKGVSGWTAMINGFAIHGRGREALVLFLQMQKSGVKPNSITFTAILAACSNTGLVDEGKSLFKSMETDYSLKPSMEHYGCMADLLGRAGLVREAIELIEAMPRKPNAAILGALLKACRIHGNIKLGKRIGKILIGMDPDHGGRYIHLASIYAASGKWDQAVNVRRKMTDQGVVKLPGCSAISLNGVVHEFFAADRFHPQIEEIYKKWYHISERLREEGYKPATEDLLLDLEDDEKKTAIHQHSEKLAIAFGLISTKPGITIRITKNLKVCNDCHAVMKLISKIYEREIVMRDRTRFHLFKDGNCTCGDYW